mmetsp:Transcript_12594/g.33868  ORF Transcript_12594/g.33868 Transcript_12594/m.33868 type:complete len:465 (+) Transcript_12594:23-1417(+)
MAKLRDDSWVAFRKLAGLALPASLQLIVDWLRPLLFNIFVSRNLKASPLDVGEASLELDSVSLAVMTVNIICFATAYGFNGSIDAFAPVAFGSGYIVELWMVLYRQLLLLLGLLMVAVATLVNAEPLLLHAGQAPDVAHRTADLLRLLVWAVPGDFAYDCLGRWMKAQQMHTAVACCAMMGLLLNVSVNLLLGNSEDPVSGPILGLILQNSLLPVLLVGCYVWSSKTKLVTVPWASLGEGLWLQGSLGVSSAVWTCAEMWAWEAQIFEAGSLGPGAMASYGILSSTYSLLIMVPLGVAVALTALLGEALGQEADESSSSNAEYRFDLLRTAALMAAAAVAVYAIPMTLARDAYAGLVSGGVRAVEATLKQVLPIIMLMHFADVLFNVLKASLTVHKHQKFGAVMSLVVYYGFGLPLGYWLAFSCNYGVAGLWMGLGSAVLVGTIWSANRASKDYAVLPDRLGIP